MEKVAYEYLANQANVAAEKKVITTDDGQRFLIGDDVHPYNTDRRAEHSVETHSLSSIVDYLKDGADFRLSDGVSLYLHVESPERVSVLGKLDELGRRETLITASLAQSVFEFGTWMKRERLNISLQASFQPTVDREAVLKFISALREDTGSVETEDDGVTQNATVKTGVTTVGKAKVPNPVSLKPYRTFTEIEQPESDFIFRLREGMYCALFEADGGMWKNEAINSIKQYFAEQLANFENITILG